MSGIVGARTEGEEKGYKSEQTAARRCIQAHRTFGQDA